MSGALPERILVTGATGLVGSAVVEELRERGARTVVRVSRRGSRTDPSVLAWDMASEDPPLEIRGDWDAIVHTAASTRWTMTPEEALAANVDTVRALARVAGRETHVVHVSTAYAVGLNGDVGSESLDDYRNTYEWSKASSERLAAELFPHLTIVRPPLTIGNRGNGKAARFSGMYLILRGITSSTVPAVVGAPDAYLDVVPVDDLASLIGDLVSAPPEPERGVLTLAGGAGAPRVEDALELIVDALNRWREERDVDPFPMPPLLSRDSWNRFFLPFAERHLTSRQLLILELLRSFEPYLEVAEPLEPTHPVTGVEDCLEASVRYWADSHEAVAAMPAQPWVAA